MSVIRIEKNKNYTVMSNYHLKDKNLSLKAKGLMSLMLSLPEDWDYSVAGLTAICSESINTVNGIIHELEDANYVQRKRIYEKGKIKEWEYVIYEEPHLYLKNQDIENQDIENLDIENKVQLNTNNKITKKLNTNNKDIAIKEIFDYWNNKNIIQHRDLKTSIIKQIDKALKEFTKDEICTYIDRYSQVINDKSYFFDTKWTLEQFLKQNNAIKDFTDSGSKWVNYKAKQGNSKIEQHTNNTSNYNDVCFTNLDEIKF